jgi:hypothetical protein
MAGRAQQESVCRLPSEPVVTPSPCTPDIDPSQDIWPLIVPGANVRKFRAYPALRPPTPRPATNQWAKLRFLRICRHFQLRQTFKDSS